MINQEPTTKKGLERSKFHHMITIEKTFDGKPFQYRPYAIEEIVFFDIETTGFVADKSFLYLIGCCYYRDATWRLIQWFAETPMEEKELLTSFISFVTGFKVCIHYNGTTFDLPYITRKCMTNQLDFSFQNLVSIDLYRTAVSLKALLHLEHCTQKAMEQVLNISREDTFSGGDLIQVYANYVGLARLEKLQKGRSGLIEEKLNHLIPKEMESSKDLLHMLLLHNEEDVIGLSLLTSLLHYQKLFDGYYQITDLSLSEDNCICFTLQPELPIPVSFSTVQYGIAFTATENTCFLRIPLLEGTLKYFIPDYKEYYYLPYEDTVVHKSIAGAMDKQYRTKATKDNCYLKKTALFLPQFEPLYTPAFQLERTDTTLYFECLDEQLQDETFLQTYTKHILQTLVHKKKRKA